MNTIKYKRRYTNQTLKILFGSSSVCAFPGCKIPIIDLGAGGDVDLVTAQVCHIHAISPDGPRWKVGLTEKYLNSPENLILLCRNHHAEVDCRHAKYSAESLKRWKQDQINGSKPVTVGSFDSSFVDEKIEDETDLLRKSRFFAEYEKVSSAIKLAERIVNGDFSNGNNRVKCKSLAWCARLLVYTEELDRAREYIEFARRLDTCPEISIAEAFMVSREGDKDLALGILNRIDSPASRTAALIVVVRHDGSRKAIVWMDDAGVDIADLDSDGKYLLLMCQFEVSEWESAERSVGALANEDFTNSPILYYAVAMAHLLSAVPDELRHDMFHGLPFNLVSFPLASNQMALEYRRLAHVNFIKARDAAQQLGCSHAETMNDECALWLELIDPSVTDQGKKRLEGKLRDYRSAIRLVRFGLQFGINLDLDAVEQEIESQIIISGEITHDAALARFSIAVDQKTPKDTANYIAHHYDGIVRHLDKKLVHSVWIGSLSHAGLLDEANETVDMLVREKGLPDEEKIHLQKIITEAVDAAPKQSRKKQFKKTNSLGDLARLVEELEAKNDWNGVCEYGGILFARTSALHDAERLAKALYNARKNERLLEFFESNKAFVSQSKKLKMIFCWSLYYEGLLQESHSELDKLDDDWSNVHYRELQILLSVSMGNWNFISTVVTNELAEKDNRNARELMRAAQLATHLDLPIAKELIFAAVDKADNDANVLASAYFLASSIGIEDSEEILQWINKAAELSDESGPVKKVALEDILAQKPEQGQQRYEIQNMLVSGDIPMLLAAQRSNKSLVHLMSFPALGNLTTKDPRFRTNIPAYSGNRHPASLKIDETIGVDATTLLTFGFLDILDDVLDAFDRVYVPHSTLIWLFGEKQQAIFHQPSQIKGAHQVRHLLSVGALEKISPSTVPDSDLSNQIGENLALLITEAEAREDGDNSQRIVVATSPVYQVGSLMKDEADLTGYEYVMSSCQAVVEKLRQKGQITAEEERRALAYLKFHEKPWPNQPEITERATLYLDGPVVTYFLHLGILDKLYAAGFKPTISAREVFEVNDLISYESTSNKVKDIIECVRSAIYSRIESGKVKVSKISPDQLSRSEKLGYSISDVFPMSEYCDALVVDDRFINKYPNISNDNTSGAGNMRVFSSLDIIDALVTVGLKSSEERLEYRTRLRQAGYLFVPIDEDELKTHLDASMVKDGKITETAELKAVRENILCARMSNYIQLPQEVIWLNNLLIVFVPILKDLWNADTDFSGARARSNWIIEQVDLRGWAHSFGKENRDNIVRTMFGDHILKLIMPPSMESQKIVNEYQNWVEENVFVPIKEQCPDLYDQIVRLQKRAISNMSDIALLQEKHSDE